MYELASRTPSDWADVALRDFNALLLDHAACERKASAVGMSFVVRYPDRPALIGPMIQFAREELEHFHQVYRLLAERGLCLGQDEPDEYVNLLMRVVRTGRKERFLDRLLTSSLIEARGHERLGLIAERLEDESLRNFYFRLTRAEGHHKDLFLEMAYLHFPKETVDVHLKELIPVEAAAIGAVPFRSALH